MNKDLYDILVNRGYSSTTINQFIKANEEGLTIPRDCDNVDIIRRFRELSVNKGFSRKQLTIIFNGLNNGIDASIYADLKYPASVMEEIFCGLIDGIDITPYINQLTSKPISAAFAAQIRLALVDNCSEEQIQFLIDLLNKNSTNYFIINTCDEIRYCFSEGIPIDDIIGINDVGELKELRQKFKSENK